MLIHYRGYEIERVTRNTYRIRPEGGEWLDLFGRYPKTQKAAKAVIDSLI